MTEEQKQECLRLYKAGVRVATIHKLIGATDGSVKRYIYKTLELSSRNIKHRISTFEKIKALRIEGKKGCEIQATLGLEKNQIAYIMRKMGASFKLIDKQK
jgi:hypothetical protein